MSVISFALTQLNVEAVMSGFPPEQRAYFESFPFWADAFWALGVFAGLAGCILLLRRKREAYRVLVVSLIGTIASTFGGLFLLDGLEIMRQTNALGLTVLPVIIGGVLASYAGAMSRNRGARSQRARRRDAG